MTEPSAYPDYDLNLNLPMPPDSDNELSLGNISPINNSDTSLSSLENNVYIRNAVHEQCQLIDFDNNNIEDIFKITIYLSRGDTQSTQSKIYFEKSCNNTYDYELVSKTNYYENYIKNSTKSISYSISIFGDIYDILTSIIMISLDNICPRGKTYSININIVKNPDSHCINFPNYNNIGGCVYDRTSQNNTFVECPVCYTTYQDGSKVLLECEHCICKVCFYRLLTQNTSYRDNKCPVCRHHIDFS